MRYCWRRIIINADNERILNFAVAQGIIDIKDMQMQIDMIERKELLSKHPYKIWHGKNDLWYTYVPDEEKSQRRALRKRKTKKEIEDVVVNYWKEKMENPTIDEVFREWNTRRVKLGQISLATFTRNIQYYNRHFKIMGKRKIKSVSEEEFSDFLEDQIAEHELTAKAFSGLKTIVRGFLKRAKRRKLIDMQVDTMLQELDVTEASFKKNRKSSKSQVFSEDELPRVIWYIENNINVLKNLGVLLILVTGIRVGEAVGIKYEDFISPNVFEIKRTETRWKSEEDGKWHYSLNDFPKTEAGFRQVVIPDDYSWIIDSIHALNPHGEFLFMTNEKRMNTEKIRRRFYYICEKLHLEEVKSPHDGRRTYASILLDNHIDDNLVTSQMGHVDIRTTETHYHKDRRSLKTKQNIFSSIPEFKNDYLVTKSNQKEVGKKPVNMG